MRAQRRSQFRRLLCSETLERRLLLTYGAPAIISQESGGLAAGNAASYVTEQALSADGRYYVFASDASDLVAGDANGQRDVFLKDLQTGSLSLISRASGGSTANSYSDEPVISADGMFVAFSSQATDLDVTDTNSSNFLQNIYRWERATGIITLVSKDSAGLDGGDNHSYQPTISANGNRIAFATYASNLVGGIAEGNSSLDVYLRDVSGETTTLVSHSAASNVTTGNSDSSVPKISRDGSRVVYSSLASDLDAGASDANNTYDLVSYLVSGNTNQYVSVETAGPTTANAGSSRTQQSLSADGRYEVFASDASDLVPGDNNGTTDVFLRDLQTGAVTLVSRGAAGAAADYYSTEAVISGNGAFVAFVSGAINLDVTGPNATNYVQNIYRWERATGVLTLVSVNADNNDGGDNYSAQPSISGDGSRIAYSTYASNLLSAVAGFVDTNGDLDVYLRDLTAASTVLVSHSTVGSLITGNWDSRDPKISRDGTRIAYLSRATDLQVGVSDVNNAYDMISYLVSAGTNQYVSVETNTPSTANTGSTRTAQSLSADGRYEVFTSGASDLVLGDTNGYTDVFLRDLQTGDVTLVSRGVAGAANYYSDEAVISADGNFVAFQSASTNLDVTGTNDTTGYQNIYRWERATGILTLVSVNSDDNSGGDNYSYQPSISGDGSRIAYSTYASNLLSAVAGFVDTNGDLDVYLRDLTAASTVLVSHSTVGSLITGNWDSRDPKISRDGTRIAYLSRATDLQVGVSDVNNAYDMISYLVSGETNEYVSVETSAATTANGGSTRTSQSLSGDGRYEVFSSDASDLVLGDTNGYTDVFLRDLQTGDVTLVSRGVAGAASNYYSDEAVISADGNFVAFQSASTNLDVTGTNDTIGYQNIYRWERATGVLTLVSVNSDDNSGADYHSYQPTISGDGSRVAFTTYASNLVAGVTEGNGDLDVYLRDVTAGSTVLVSHSTAGSTTTGNEVSIDPKISRDGTRVAYRSRASDLQTGVSDANNTYDLVSYLVSGDTNEYVSVETTAATTANGGSSRTSQSLSADGLYEVFASDASDLVPGDSNGYTDVFLRDLQTGDVTLVSRGVGGAAANYYSDEAVISADGNFVAFQSAATNLDVTGTNDANGYQNIYRWERATGILTLVSVNADDNNGAGYHAYEPTISGDGSRIAFSTYASDLVTGVSEVNGDLDVYLRDVGAGTTALLSASATSSTTTGNAVSQFPRISRDGSTVVFFSRASDLESGISDSNGDWDLFAFDVATATISTLSVDVTGSATGDQAIVFGEVSLADDGQTVAFSSYSANLDPLDANGTQDVFVRTAGATSLISINSAGTASGDNASGMPSISGNGDYVAFQTYASDLGTASNGQLQVVVRDRIASATTLISVNSDGSTPGNALSQNPRISHGGDFVVFESYVLASDLDGTITADSNGDRDIFVRDWTAGSPATTLLSRQASSTLAGNRGSALPEISDDGGRIVFDSAASDLDGGVADVNGSGNDLFAYDGTLSVVSAKGPGVFTGRSGVGGGFDQSDSGELLAFATSSLGMLPDLDGIPGHEQVYLRDLGTSGTERVSVDSDSTFADYPATSPSLSGDGRYVAFQSYATNLGTLGNGNWQVYVRDRGAGPATTTLVSVKSSGLAAGDNTSQSPRISHDGHTVVFESYVLANELDPSVSADSNGDRDIFVRNWDAVSPSTTLLSRNASSTGAGNRGSALPEISDDGGRIVFDSAASNLVSSVADVNGSGNDIFAYDGTLSVVTAKGPGVFTGRSGVVEGFDQSDSGELLAFSTGSLGMLPDVDGIPGHEQVYLRDLVTSSTERVSVDSDSTFADYPATSPSISGDGRYVAFQSYATNLGTLGNGNWQVYVRDRGAGPATTTLISVNSAGTAAGDNTSQNPRISHDGHTVVFESYVLADQLDATITSDTNGDRDVFVRHWDAVAPTTKLLSRKASSTEAGNRGSANLEVSDNGGRIVFDSAASDLVSGVTDVNGGANDIFAYDGTLAVITLKAPGVFTADAGAALIFDQSDNGEIIAFSSNSVGLVPEFGDVPSYEQVYLRDLSTSTTERVSIDDDSTFADYPANSPSVSGDGRYVAFQSYATNLGTLGNGNWQVYVRDRGAGPATTTLVSVMSTGLAAGDNTSQSPRISHDGHTVVFESYVLADQLDATITADTNGDRDVFVRDWDAALPTTKLLSRNGASTVAGNRGSAFPEVSDNGGRIVFDSASSDLVSGVADVNGSSNDLFAYDGTLSVVTAKGPGVFTVSGGVSGQFDLSDTGQFVVFSNNSFGLVADVDGVTGNGQVYLRDLSTSTTERISVDSDSTYADYPAQNPSISGDGRYVTFESYATNLGTIPNPAVNWQIYVRDRGAGPATTNLISVTSDGTQASVGASNNARISHDGQTVVFDSDSTDLDASITSDTNGARDIFVRKWTAVAPVTQLVSRVLTSDVAGDAASNLPRINDDGSTLAFTSSSSDLTALTDGNGTQDVFAVRQIALAINSVSIVEGDSGTSNLVFTVELLSPTTAPVSVDYTTVDGTATLANNDYLLTTNTLTYAVGETLKTIVVPIVGDLVLESNEVFTVFLSNVVNAEILYGTGTGTIINDDTEVNVADASIIEGNSGNVNLEFVVTLVVPSTRTVTVDYATSNLTATLADNDYLSTSGTLTFDPGQTTKTILVPVVGDTTPEAHEKLRLTLTNPVHALVIDGEGDGTILNDDTNASISSTSILEGNSGNQTAQLMVTLSHASALTVTLDYATANGSGTLADNDYLATSGTLTFTPGQTTQTISVDIVGDTTPEDYETVLVNLSNPSNTGITTGQGVITIENDDTHMSINDVTVTELDAGTVAAVFTISLTKPSALPVSVQVDTQNNSAIAPQDYEAIVGSIVSFGVGETSKTVTVNVASDLLDEFDETFFVNLSSPTNATVVDAQGQGTITDNDPPPVLSINDATVTEGDGVTVNAVFTVSLDAPSGKTITVNYATQADTALSPADFAANSGTLTFLPGETSQQISVAVVGDLLDEFDENFFVNLTAPSNASLGDAQGQGTITDNDPPPAVSINDVTVTEGNAGTVNAVFAVTLDAPSGKTITVNYATQADSAVSPADFAATSGTLTFLPGETSMQITVAVAADVLDEIDETFFVNLTSPSNATLGDAQGQGTITDNDPPPVLSINDVTLTEGDSGTNNAVFTVSLDAPSGKTITVIYATQDGSAVSPADYAAVNGTLTFLPGETSMQVSVAVVGDLLDEIDETFLVNLTSPSNATLGDAQGQATITDNDPPPALSINDVTITEGDGGTVNAVFTVSLDAPSGKTITVNYATQDGSAVSPADYALTLGTLTFLPGETSMQISVPVVGDLLDEFDETFLVNLASPSNATLADAQGEATITDNDPPPVLSISDVNVTEGNAGTVNAVFIVSLDAPSGKTITINYATQDGTAVSPADFAATSGTVTFLPGETSMPITVAVAGDLLDEIDETFLVNLTSPSNATLGDAQGQGTITDNDPPPVLSISDVTLIEGDSGTSNAVFTVSLDSPSGKTITVNYATQDGSAVSPADYLSALGTLTFLPGETSMQVSVAVVGDLLDEIDETFLVNLTSPSNATLGDAQGQATITDNDLPPAVSIDDVIVVEGNGVATNAVFTVSLDAPSGKTITVNYATQADSALSPADFAATSGTLTFLPGETSMQISVPIVGDQLDEFDETFYVNLTAPSNATLGDAQGQATITDDDPPPSLSIDDVSVLEGDAGTTVAVFTVSLSGASGKTITVNYATQDDTAVAPNDYVSTSGTLTFLPGETSMQVFVTIAGDLLDEIDETFFVNLTLPSNATLNDSQGQGLINDNDPAPSLSINDVTVTEGNSGTTNAVFIVSLSAPSGKTITVDYATQDGSAISPSDYGVASGTLTFLPGETSKEISVSVVGDVLDELTESFLVNLSNAVNAAVSDAQGIGTILTDEAPKVDSITIGDGTMQRSNVSQITVNFNSHVTIDDSFADAIAVRRLAGSYGPAADVATTWTTTEIGGKTQLVIHFTGLQTRGSQNALKDGNYVLELKAERIRLADSPTIKLDGDGNGVGGDDYAYGNNPADYFYAMFGDINRDRKVDSVDYLAFRSSYEKSPGQMGYNANFDYNGGGVIDGIDYFFFRQKYGKDLGF